MDPDSWQFGIMSAALLANMTSGLSEVQCKLSGQLMFLYVNKCPGLCPLSNFLQKNIVFWKLNVNRNL
jgi:hypothetical protein